MFSFAVPVVRFTRLYAPAKSLMGCNHQFVDEWRKLAMRQDITSGRRHQPRRVQCETVRAAGRGKAGATAGAREIHVSLIFWNIYCISSSWQVTFLWSKMASLSLFLRLLSNESVSCLYQLVKYFDSWRAQDDGAKETHYLPNAHRFSKLIFLFLEVLVNLHDVLIKDTIIR